MGLGKDRPPRSIHKEFRKGLAKTVSDMVFADHKVFQHRVLQHDMVKCVQIRGCSLETLVWNACPFQNAFQTQPQNS